MANRVVSIGLSVLALAWAVPAQERASVKTPPAAYTAKLGSLEVRAEDDIVLPDAERETDLEVKVYYPTEGGPYPVIIFSHGMGDSKNTAPRLMRHWASHGYVCILPMHAARHLHNLRFSLIRTWREAEALGDEGADFWEERIHDIRLLIDSLPVLEEKAPGLEGRMDPKRVAIGGHSLGAATAALVSGATVFHEDGTPRAYKDERVCAVLMLSPPGSGVGGLTKDSWKGMDLPMMVVGGSKDPDLRTPRGPLWRTEPYRFAPPGDKYRVILFGATHATYARPLTDRKTDKERTKGPIYRLRRFIAQFKGKPHKSVMYDSLQVATLAFWDAYLKEGGVAKRAEKFLAADGLIEFSHEWALVSRK